MRKRIYPLIFLILTFILLGSTVYAWFSLGSKTTVDFIEMNVGTDQVETYLYIKKNNEEEVRIINQDDILIVLNLGVPGDEYQFRLRIVNHRSKTTKVNLTLKNVISRPHLGYEEADIRDVYVIEEAKINYGANFVTLTPNSTTPAVGLDGQELSVNRINNFINTNYIVLLNQVEIPVSTTTDVTFTIKFDENITNNKYRGQLEIEEMLITIGD